MRPASHTFPHERWGRRLHALLGLQFLFQSSNSPSKSQLNDNTARLFVHAFLEESKTGRHTESTGFSHVDSPRSVAPPTGSTSHQGRLHKPGANICSLLSASPLCLLPYHHLVTLEEHATRENNQGQTEWYFGSPFYSQQVSKAKFTQLSKHPLSQLGRDTRVTTRGFHEGCNGRLCYGQTPSGFWLLRLWRV